MKPLLILSLLFASVSCFAQRQNVYFLKNNGKHVAVRDSADFIRIVREPDSGSVFYNVFEFYPNGTNKLIGKSSLIDSLLLEEQCITYYKNGHKQKICTYKNGRPINNECDYYPNGKLYQTKQFPADGKYDNELENNFLLTECRDSLGANLVTNGDGHYVGYDDDFKKITEEGNIVKGNRQGQWKGRYDNFLTRFIEVYNNGVLISGIATHDNGKRNAYTKSRTVPPYFIGDAKSFVKYLALNIKYPDYAREKKIQGTVILKFTVQSDGNILNIHVIQSVSPDIDKEALRVMKNSPPWIPGTKFGIPVSAEYSVPITFSLN